MLRAKDGGLRLVYFELAEGMHVGTHTDSAEEVLLVLGTAEATVGDRRIELRPRETAVVPALVEHDVRNVGEGVLRVVGFFAAGEVESVFAQVLEPTGERVFRVPPPAGG